MYTLDREKHKYSVEFYKDKRGRCPAIEFLKELQTKVRAKVANAFIIIRYPRKTIGHDTLFALFH